MGTEEVDRDLYQTAGLARTRGLTPVNGVITALY